MLDQRQTAHAGDVLRDVPRDAGVRSLYLHVPFCFHKCHYCDFYSIVDTRDRQEAFVTRLSAELAALSAWAGPLETLFVGGGTPSLLRPDLWSRLLDALHRSFDCSPLATRGEFTIECNPETVTPELMRILKGGGVTRVSLGAQSFEARHLKTLERRHDPANVARSLEIARDAGIARQSIDLIFGIPGQSLGEWRRDLDAALSLGTEHLSCYNLTYEPDTAMTARLGRGDFARADEDLEVEMYRATLGTLRAAGFERYEVSNYAKPGAECRHNMVYWRQENWLAAGPSASAHVAGHRWKNTPRLETYLREGAGGFAPIADHEPPAAARALSERLMTGIRVSEGLDAGRMLRAAADLDPDAADRLSLAVARQAEKGWLTREKSRWQLTDEGFLFADSVALDLMTALDAR